MEKILPLPYKKFDLILLVAVVILIIIGLSTIQSTIIADASSNPILNYRLINTQVLSISAGVLIFIALSFINYRYLHYATPVIYLMIIGLLVWVLVIGTETRGSVRWFEIGPVNFQPSSVATVLLILVLASFFNYVKDKINNIFVLAGSFLLAAIPAGLLILEPDLGSSVVVCFIWFALLHFTPIKLSRLFLLYALILVILPMVWFNIADYQKDRIVSFVNPQTDPLGTGYNALQSIIAVGSGEVLGRGWGRGTQSHLQFLPEQHTDFIFATFSEEQGFIGSIIIIALYGVIIWRMFLLLKHVPEYYPQLIVLGIVTWLFIHIFINISMNIGIAPITGIPLPFLSYGGSAIITTFLALGLVSSVQLHSTRVV